MSLDTDGGLLFNLGILATLGNEQPQNLFVVVWDNEQYQSIGGPAHAHRVGTRGPRGHRPGGGRRARLHGRRPSRRSTSTAPQGSPPPCPYIVVAKTDGILEPGIKRKHSDGREDTYTFVRHVERTEGISIMGPSEHN